MIRSAEYAIPGASIENIEYLPDRNLDKTLISRLASCTYVLETNNVIILGATGTGKTYIASALGMAAGLMTERLNKVAFTYSHQPDEKRPLFAFDKAACGQVHDLLGCYLRVEFEVEDFLGLKDTIIAKLG